MSSGIKKLLLLGAGHANLRVLAHLATHHPADLDVTLVSPYPWHSHAGRAADVVAGRCPPSDGQIAIEPLVLAAHARWVQGRCTGLDAQAGTVQLAAAGGAKDVPAQLGYDWLSLNTGAMIDRQRLDASMPGAAGRALIVRPLEAFIALWPQVLDMARSGKALSIVVIGAGVGGLELLFAVEERLRREGLNRFSLSLLTGGGEVAADMPPGARQHLLARLRRLNVTVLREACTGVQADAVTLGNGASLRCDVPLLAIGSHAPPWLQTSGLALDDSGHVRVNAQLQSTSHPNVFAAGDLASRAAGGPQKRNAAQARRSGLPLAHNLLAAHAGQPLKPHHPPQRTLELIDTGHGQALACWGGLHAAGGWAAAWKARRERAYIASLRVPTA